MKVRITLPVQLNTIPYAGNLDFLDTAQDAHYPALKIRHGRQKAAVGRTLSYGLKAELLVSSISHLQTSLRCFFPSSTGNVLPMSVSQTTLSSESECAVCHRPIYLCHVLYNTYALNYTCLNVQMLEQPSWTPHVGSSFGSIRS